MLKIRDVRSDRAHAQLWMPGKPGARLLHRHTGTLKNQSATQICQSGPCWLSRRLHRDRGKLINHILDRCLDEKTPCARSVKRHIPQVAFHLKLDFAALPLLNTIAHVVAGHFRNF